MNFKSKFPKNDMAVLAIKNDQNTNPTNLELSESEQVKVDTVAALAPQRPLYPAELEDIAKEKSEVRIKSLQTERIVADFDITSPETSQFVDAIVIRRTIEDAEGFDKFGQTDLCTKFPNSGITIGTGIDLGHTTAESLKKQGIREDIIARIPKEFYGKKGDKAISTLDNYKKKNGIDFMLYDSDEANTQAIKELSEKYLVSGIQSVQKKYNNATGGEKLFMRLSEQRRTLLLSIEHQYGNKPQKEKWDLWKDIVAGNWQDVEDNLNGQDWKSPNDKGVRRRLSINASLASNKYK